MNESVTSLILIAATIIIGLVVFSFLGGYFTVQSAQVNDSKEAQVLSTSLQVKQLVNQEGDENYVVIYPFLKGYNGPLYVVAFSLSSFYSSSQNLITPAAPTFNGWVDINGTPGKMENVKVYNTGDGVLYDGSMMIYTTSPNAVQFINFNQGSTVMVWFLVNINGEMARIGYTILG
ncbi:hypothetical protein [Sulfuracidifex tepidarius]|uniref:Archaeal Type IV pilin N-terminal domain-containing protein n=1 Tax=Sulfuracidifex tepidarius TaxID=1294262 RepID=A0A510DU02_9CREN|nr:hypothetical protein [Sulfuracidifex tepidarius]BBG23649.1 hypothetical protein IC006_0937 [Sulfuracidifex tepidarius]BBG26396.1 hypothetical protein IC007_0904 [Sulfuracidifex tepidarius]